MKDQSKGILRKQPEFLFTYAYHEDEEDLCRLELRTLFGDVLQDGYLLSGRRIDPSRSPFVKLRIEVSHEAGSAAELAEEMPCVELDGATFKVVFAVSDGPEDYGDKRAVEREVGFRIRGKADMRRPDRLFGIAHVGGRWLFGECRYNEAVWLHHAGKPQNYSTALSTKVARAVANIAVPDPEGVRAVDPCCGMGTVLIEALSMGIDIVGYDRNPQAVRGAKVNLSHFRMPEVAAICDIRDLKGSFDAAVIDMPYNLCSVLSEEDTLEMLVSARRLANRVLVITTESADSVLEQAGFDIIDRCLVRKGTFTRYIRVCQ